MRKINLIATFLFGISLLIGAQAPNMFNYQAAIRDGGGLLLSSQEISMRVSLLQGGTNGTPVYTETHNVTTSDYGIINILIGTGNSSDNFESIGWKYGPFFLKVEIDTAGGANYIELATTQLLSVPYALYAEHAGTVAETDWKRIGNDLYYYDGKIGIGTATPTSLLNLYGNVGSGSERNIFQLHNTNESALAYTGIKLKTGFSEGHSVIQDYGMTYTASSAYDFYGFLNVANSNRGVMLHANSAEGVIKFYTGHDDIMGAGLERMRIDAKGNIGIGTSLPKTKLHIMGNAIGEDRALIRLRNIDDSYQASVSMALESNDGIYGSAFTQTSDSYTAIPDFDRMGVISTNGKGFSIYSVSDYGSIRFYTNRNENGIIERMRINPDGYIGIGTATPASLLNLYGNVGSGTERNIFQLHNTNESALAYTGIKLKTGFSEGHSVIQDYGMTYTASSAYDFYGFLNVANSNRGVMLHANSAEGVIKFYTGHDDIMGAGLERMRIDATGNIGIGTDSVKSKLQIADGDIYISDINKGIILTSPDGKCWRGTMNNSGVLEFAAIDCP